MQPPAQPHEKTTRGTLKSYSLEFLSSSVATMSATRDATAATTTRHNALGPLTTVFTADPTCMTLMFRECGSSDVCTGWLAQTCTSDLAGTTTSYGPSNEFACFPPLTSGTVTETYGGWGFYSPGLSCPSGYTSACSATAGATGSFQFEYPLVLGETAVGCCPTYVYNFD
jgi:hypothetical protein